MDVEKSIQIFASISLIAIIIFLVGSILSNFDIPIELFHIDDVILVLISIGLIILLFGSTQSKFLMIFMIIILVLLFIIKFGGLSWLL